jgi:hypothetical protein
MNEVVFQEFLDWFKLKTAERKVLFFIDDYKAHETGLDL